MFVAPKCKEHNYQSYNQINLFHEKNALMPTWAIHFSHDS